MFRDLGFQSRFSARKIKRDSEGRIRIGMTFKSVHEGEVQNFLAGFDEATKVQIERNFVTPINWKTITFPMPYNLKVEVEFGEDKFEAELVEVKVNHKISQSGEFFEYMIYVEKETNLDNFDTKFEETYFQYKEEDEEGKKKFVDFTTSFRVLSEDETLM